MNHRGPRLPNDLSDRITNLEKEYLSSRKWNKNPKRIELINLIKSFTLNKEQVYNHQAAIGICTYGLIKIDASCSMFHKPKKSHYKMFGSQLGELLQKNLDISFSNPLDDQSALIYLTSLCQHLKKYPRDMSGKLIKEMENDELINDIHKQIQVVLLSISTKRPTYNALKNNFSNIATEYLEFSGKNPKRDQYVEFFKILNSDLNRAYPTEDKHEKEASDSYSIRYAAILYMMDKIESEYTYLSPEGGRINSGSALYKSCKQAININYNSKEVPDELKRKYYVGLLYYVLKIKLDRKLVEKWEQQGLVNAKTFFDKLSSSLAERVADLLRVTKPDAVSMSYLGLASSAAASHGVSIALGKLATEIHLRGKALTYFNYIRPEAALLITILTYAANAYVMKKATSAVNTVIIKTVSEPVIITFSTMQKLGQFCLAFLISETNTNAKELTDSKEFMKALHSLPDEVLTDHLKDKLKHVVDYTKKESPEEILNNSLLAFH